MGFEHMHPGDGQYTHFVQRHHQVPVLEMPSHEQQHPVAPADALRCQEIGRLVGQTADVPECQDTLLTGLVAPDERTLAGFLGGDGIDHIIGKIVCILILQRKFRQLAVCIKCGLAEFPT